MATATLTTSAEFLRRPDEFDQSGNRVKEELIGGEIVQMPHASKRHDITKSLIARILFRYLDAHSEHALTVLIEAGFVVTEHDTFGPDVAVVLTERLAEEGRLIQRAPEIAIEVISPTDTVSGIRRKIKAYLENGALSVWIFYDEGSIAVHNSSQVRELSGEQKLEDPLLPGFSVSASTFFTQA
jgi:Uma2 family endonuclease